MKLEIVTSTVLAIVLIAMGCSGGRVIGKTDSSDERCYCVNTSSLTSHEALEAVYSSSKFLDIEQQIALNRILDRVRLNDSFPNVAVGESFKTYVKADFRDRRCAHTHLELSACYREVISRIDSVCASDTYIAFQDVISNDDLQLLIDHFNKINKTLSVIIDYRGAVGKIYCLDYKDGFVTTRSCQINSFNW